MDTGATATSLPSALAVPPIPRRHAGLRLESRREEAIHRKAPRSVRSGERRHPAFRRGDVATGGRARPENHGREVFDATKLQPYYEAAISLCTFVAANGGIDFGKRHREIYRWKGAPPVLLALCALVLFVSDWNMNAATTAFAKLLAAPPPSDLVLGNVIGLNPFHDYGAWRLVIASSEVAARSPNGLDYGARLAAIEAELREQHRLWKSEQPRG